MNKIDYRGIAESTCHEQNWFPNNSQIELIEEAMLQAVKEAILPMNDIKNRLKLLRKALEKNTDSIEYHHCFPEELKYVNIQAFLKYNSKTTYQYRMFRGLLLHNPKLAKLQRLLFIDILIESL